MSKELINIIGQISPSPIVSTTTNTTQNVFIKALPVTEVSAGVTRETDYEIPEKWHGNFVINKWCIYQKLSLSGFYYCLSE